MATVSVEPDSVTGLSHNNWTNSGGSDKADSCAAPDDDDTTYVKTIDITAQDLKATDASWPSAVGFVNTVICRARWRIETVASKTLTYGVENGSGTATSTDVTSGTTYVNDTTASLSRPGGGDWTAADFARDTTWMHFSVNADGGNAVRVTSMRIDIDYETPSSVVPFFLSWLTSTGLVYPFLEQFAAHIQAVGASEGKFSLRPDEILRQWDLYKSNPFRAYAL